jgi:hypothetical protein
LGRAAGEKLGETPQGGPEREAEPVEMGRHGRGAGGQGGREGGGRREIVEEDQLSRGLGRVGVRPKGSG